MLHHRTNDPCVKAAHIADRLEREHEQTLIASGQSLVGDWPHFWLRTYRQLIHELSSTVTDFTQQERII